MDALLEALQAPQSCIIWQETSSEQKKEDSTNEMPLLSSVLR